ncbi:MAG: ABC transporter ATP-binding protein [Bacteroidota bacterium]
MPTAALTPRPDAPAVVLEGLTKTYREGEQQREVLYGVEATIERGEFIVLLGRSGSGKSTLLNLISGIDLPTSGRVVLGGVDLTRETEHARTLFRRHHIGFVFQAFNLIPTLTVAENLLLPLELSGTLTDAESERALDILGEVGLRDRADSFPDRLSGGEQQRVAIARALAHDPLLILADEPTGNLDYQTAEQVLRLIDRLVRQAGKTTLMVTHDRSLIDLADRVLTLRSGKLVAADVTALDA